VFFRVTLRQALPSILGGGLLVAMSLFASFGAIQILGYQTFATAIFEEFHQSFDTAAASALSLVLVCASLLLLAGEGLLRGRGRLNRSARQTRMSARRVELHRLGIPALFTLAAIVVLAVGVPVGTLIYWMVSGSSTTLPAATTFGAAIAHTAGYGAAAAAAATMAAMPVAFATTRVNGRIATLLERSTFIVQALPGLVIALALVSFSIRYVFGLYQSSVLLVFAYAVLFFPLALVALRASVLQAPIGLEETGRSLGRGRLAVWWRVTLPLVAPGAAAAFSLVFLSAVTELTATLILVPTGVQTLATQFWAYQENGAYGAASPFALMSVVLAAVPCVLLARWFDRLPAAAGIS
jgi:iron(III) transport system permease protein